MNYRTATESHIKPSFNENHFNKFYISSYGTTSFNTQALLTTNHQSTKLFFANHRVSILHSRSTRLMMFLTKKLLFLSIFSAISFFHFLPASADHFFSIEEKNRLLEFIASPENKLSEQERRRLFEVKNAKGEIIHFRSFIESKGNEKGLWATFDPTQDKPTGSFDKNGNFREGIFLNEDFKNSFVEGTSTDKVFQRIKFPNRKKREVVVAVIDSGVDINHEDLKGHIWTHPKDLHCNFHNDIHGWNFLGNKNGKNVTSSNLELTRIYASLIERHKRNELTPHELTFFNQISNEYSKKSKEIKSNLNEYKNFMDAIHYFQKLGLKTETIDSLNLLIKNLKISTDNSEELYKKASFASKAFNVNLTSSIIQFYINYYQLQNDYLYDDQKNETFNISSIINDNPNTLNEMYGNNDVIGVDEENKILKDANGTPINEHGTHVAGIIAALRSNNLGILGQTDNVKIMPIRAIPFEGDERDKDVANAIYYAVNHHADIINMSFGKAYSPQKYYVDAAVKYAEAHGVLLVHAAGNEGFSTDPNTEDKQHDNFPNRILKLKTGSTREAGNWIEVGASSMIKNMDLPASFSNYGESSVDLFAPGVNIVSTLPENSYGALSGTSMASPEVAGVAALILEFKRIQPKTLRQLLLDTVNPYKDLLVNQPKPDDEPAAELVNFSALSQSGGTVNAYQAILKLLEK